MNYEQFYWCIGFTIVMTIVAVLAVQALTVVTMWNFIGEIVAKVAK